MLKITETKNYAGEYGVNVDESQPKKKSPYYKEVVLQQFNNKFKPTTCQKM